ncbi:hypothetical protein CLOLEP_02150 [[Clostridium] leptum DSM 753]|uniref:Uncharacterized protein n=1 Tax=[Clostridium] leptum DSM 753 TaxID=428125 RepID=A7VUA4_9FIRM|nr:hypothetical protein CLOLEP_02150 [[Clostridium] leptum DSM 753]
MRQNFPFAALAGHNKKRFGIFSNRFLDIYSIQGITSAR